MPEIRIDGEPVAKQRPRRGNKGSWYTPRQTHDYEQIVAWEWRKTRLKAIQGPVAVSMHFYVGGRDKDLDNMVKAVLDGLQGVAFCNDRQVVRMAATKLVKPGQGHAIVKVEAL